MTFLVAIGDNGKALKQAANAIARDIGNHYIVGFVGDGTTDQLRFELANRPRVTIKIDTK